MCKKGLPAVWTKEKIEEAFAGFVEKNRRLPVAREMKPQYGLPTRRTFERYMDTTAQEYAELRYDEEWAAEDNKFRSITSFTASRASLRELRDYLADTLKYARIRAERQIKAGELPGGWFDPKDWDGWQKHMEGLIHRLDGVLALEGSTLELAHPPAPTVPELTM